MSNQIVIHIHCGEATQCTVEGVPEKAISRCMPPVRQDTPNPGQLTELESDVCRILGLCPEDFLKALRA